MKSNGHKFPYGATVHIKNRPERLGIVENYSSGENIETLVFVKFLDSNFRCWYREETLEQGSGNPSRRDCC